jgi:type I restriction enzyme S subunit
MPDYLLQASKHVSFLRQMERRSNATAQAGLYLGELAKLRIPLPPPDHQKAIAEILSRVDEAIEQTEVLIAKTQQIKAGLMHDLFTRGVTPDGHLRPPRAEAPKLYKESPLGWIPKEWDADRLSDKRGPNRAHLKTGPFGSSLKLEHWVDEGRPVITIGALGEGEFIADELLHVSEATAEWCRTTVSGKSGSARTVRGWMFSDGGDIRGAQ